MWRCFPFDCPETTARTRRPGPQLTWLPRHPCTAHSTTLNFLTYSCFSTYEGKRDNPHIYSLIFKKNQIKFTGSLDDFCGSFTRSCHNFTHQNCVAIYCAGFPNWLASAGVIVVSLNLSVILSLLKVIKLNKYTNVQYIVYKTNKHCQVLVSCSDLNCHDHNNHALICQTGLTVILWGCLIGYWTWSLNLAV